MTETAKIGREGRRAKTGIGSHTRAFRGQTDCWLTPPEIIEALGPFDLDPCAAPGQPWPTARHHYVLPQDGLQLPWLGRVWLNPPYGPQTGMWLHRLSQHGNGIALVFARTETAWFFEHVWGKVAGALFLEGRLHFHHVDGTRAKGSSGGPSVLLAYGNENARLLQTSPLKGAYCTPIKRNPRRDVRDADHHAPNTDRQALRASPPQGLHEQAVQRIEQGIP